TALAERSGDSAFLRNTVSSTCSQSGVAPGLPPQSKIFLRHCHFEDTFYACFRRATKAPSTLSTNGNNSRSSSSVNSECLLKNSFTTPAFSSGSRLQVL